MSSKAAIKNHLQSIIKKNIEHNETILGTCKNVDSSNLTCDVTPLSTGSDILDVELKVYSSDDKSIIQIPENYSLVLVLFTSDKEPFIIWCEKSVETRILTNDSSIVLNEDITIEQNSSKIILQNDGIVVEKSGVNLGNLMNQLLTAIQNLTVPTPAGISGVPNNVSVFTQIKQQFSQLLK